MMCSTASLPLRPVLILFILSALLDLDTIKITMEFILITSIAWNVWTLVVWMFLDFCIDQHEYDAIEEDPQEKMTATTNTANIRKRTPISVTTDDELDLNKLNTAWRKKVSLKTLEELKFNCNTLTSDRIGILISMSLRNTNKLQLNKLSLIISNEDGQNGVEQYQQYKLITYINKFLTLQSNTLKSLDIQIDKESDQLGLALKVPKMWKLEDLRLAVNYNGIKIHFDESFAIPINFPKLKTITYDVNGMPENPSEEDETNVYWKEHTSFSNPLLSLQEFRTINMMDSNKLYRLSEIFPNIVKLDIQFKLASMIGNIWNKWPNLEQLSIGYFKDDDDNGDNNKDSEEENEMDIQNGLLAEYISGIPTKFHASCLSMINNSSLGSTNWKSLKTKPGISDLKNLTHFRFYSEDLRVSDLAVYCGLLHPNTKLVELEITYGNKISSACLAAIRENLGPDAKIEIMSYFAYDES